MHPQLSTIHLGGKNLEVARYGHFGERSAIVLLHEALGSVSHWRHFPAQLARATECEVVTYSRVGHGHSEGPVEKRGFDYIERQATTILAGLLERLQITRPVLFGHSEGAVISLFFASAMPAALRGAIIESPVVEVEAATVHGMRKAKEAYHSADLKIRLQRHHRDADGVFRAFADPWLAEGTSASGFEDRLRRIACPVLLLQGDRDEYSTTRQTEILSSHLPNSRAVIVEDCGHTPHREKPAVVLEHVAEFVRELL